MEPEVYALGIQLADAAARNSASTIADKIRTVKARKKNEETIAELEEIVSNLISDKSDLLRISQAYQQELAGQRISDSDVEYITSNIIPILKQLVEAGDGEESTASPDRTIDTRALDAIEALLSVETVNILQLVGFNFRRAIGEPLTQLIARLISSQASLEPALDKELQLMQVKREVEYFALAQDPEAYARLQEMLGSQRQ
jgi:hypothetical protein